MSLRGCSSREAKAKSMRKCVNWTWVKASWMQSLARQRICSEILDPAIGTGSTNTSPACATWSNGWQCCVNGRASPKPRVSAAVPLDPASPKDYMEKVKLMYDMARLAFETDSTRSISLLLDSVNSPAIE